jgi:hypothetical protein
MENNREHKKILKHFPSEDLISELKKIESLIIGFTMIITHYKSKSYTNVAYSIGYQCLFNIFINKKEVQEAKDEARKAQDEARRARDEAAQTKASCEAMKQRVIDFEARLAAKK